MTGHAGHEQVPPSAAGHLEPYGVRVSVAAGPISLDAQKFLVALLEELAADSMASGGSVIGHLKCLLHLPKGAMACNLTSLRSGARCSTRGLGHETAAMAAPSTSPAVLAPGSVASLDLAVLIYGLPAANIDFLVRAVLGRLLDPLDVSWAFGDQAETSLQAC